jgi:hypothetical protein
VITQTTGINAAKMSATPTSSARRPEIRLAVFTRGPCQIRIGIARTAACGMVAR